MLMLKGKNLTQKVKKPDADIDAKAKTKKPEVDTDAKGKTKKS